MPARRLVTGNPDCCAVSSSNCPGGIWPGALCTCRDGTWSPAVHINQGCYYSATTCLGNIYSSAIYRAGRTVFYRAATSRDGTGSPAVVSGQWPVSAAEPAAMQYPHTQHKILFQASGMENYREIVIASKFERGQAVGEQPCRALSARPADIRNITAAEKYKYSVQLLPERVQSTSGQQAGRSLLPTLPTTQQYAFTMSLSKPPQSIDCGHPDRRVDKKGLMRFCPQCAALAKPQREILVDFCELLQPSEEDVARLQTALALLSVGQGPDFKLENTMKQERSSLFSPGARSSLGLPTMKTEALTPYTSWGAGSLGGGVTSNPPSPTNSMFLMGGRDGYGVEYKDERKDQPWDEKHGLELAAYDECFQQGLSAGAMATVEKVFPEECGMIKEEAHESGYDKGYCDGYATREQEQERAGERPADYWAEEEDGSDVYSGEGDNLAGPDAGDSDEPSADEFYMDEEQFGENEEDRTDGEEQ